MENCGLKQFAYEKSNNVFNEIINMKIEEEKRNTRKTKIIEANVIIYFLIVCIKYELRGYGIIARENGSVLLT